MSEERVNSGSNQTEHVTEEKIRVKKPDMYRIILLNDDYTPREFVVWILVKVFYKNISESKRIMMEAHTKGRSIVGVYTYDVAKTKLGQVEALAEKYEHPLKCILEVDTGEESD